ncbi:MAG: hypothetical protein M3Y49_20135 [Actinomycetota bacterium]|nr:hypothetical protein [Actinomycetota bacterium]
MVQGRSFVSVFSSWDAHHYLAIAEHGYLFSFNPANLQSPAFFPGYPALVRVTSLNGVLPTLLGAVVVSLVSSIGFVGALSALGRRLNLTQRQILAWVALVSVAPMSIVLMMPYSESLFCCLAAWALVKAIDGKLWACSLLTLCAGTVRPTSVGLSCAILVVGIGQIRSEHPGWPQARRLGQVAAAAALSALGMFAYLAWVGWRMGAPLAWFQLQSHIWNTRFDFGAATLQYIHTAFTTAPALLDVVTALVVVAAVMLCFLTVRKTPAALWSYTLVTLAQVLGSDGIMNSKIRLMVPAFILLIPIITWVTGPTGRRQNLVYALAAVASASYTAYALVLYPYAI